METIVNTMRSSWRAWIIPVILWQNMSELNRECYFIVINYSIVFLSLYVVGCLHFGTIAIESGEICLQIMSPSTLMWLFEARTEDVPFEQKFISHHYDLHEQRMNYDSMITWSRLTELKKNIHNNSGEIQI